MALTKQQFRAARRYNARIASSREGAAMLRAVGRSRWDDVAIQKIADWQLVRGLTPDGKVGPATLRELAQEGGLGSTAQGYNVVIIGDSHVEALGPQLTRKLPTVGVNVLGYTTRRGWSTSRYNSAGDLARLVTRPEHGQGGRPDAVIISLGGNGRPRSKSAYRTILQNAVDAVRRSGVQRIVWMGPATSVATVSERSADAHRRHEQNANWMAELLPQMGVPFVDARPMTRTGHAADGVHFTMRTGYPAWAEAAKGPLAQAVASGGAPSGGAAPRGGGGGKVPGGGGMTFAPKMRASLLIPIAILGVAVTIFVATITLSGRRQRASMAA